MSPLIRHLALGLLVAFAPLVALPVDSAAAQKRRPRARSKAAAKSAGARPAAGGKAVVKGAVKGAVIDSGEDASVDWTRGLVLGTGAAAADMRAPSAEIARVRAERQARERALAAARARLDGVTFEGRPIGERDDRRAAIDRAVGLRARDLAVRFGSDGSAQVTVGIPLESVRAAMTGPQALVSGEPAADAPTALVIDARRLRGRLAPVLGLKVVAGETEFSAPTVYVADIGAARADPRVGPRPLEIRAKRYSGGVLTVEGGEALDKLAAARQPLVVLVIKARRSAGGRSR